ncbi:hypothetical protein [Roseimaritima ulvae]|uniref:Uncharacterized protein n=1 Tax=Roseimaritima ulvae TaxID=980254 RepID=A0A5B9QMD8_9BACT|nr:hypothetical protein [Roseimaritima ulvae]QEG38790.1 hypothetical protein UC8_07480 [Roseimaritima ulvae]
MNEADVVNEASSHESSPRKPAASSAGSLPPAQADLVQAKLVQPAASGEQAGQPSTPHAPPAEGLYQQVLHSRLAILATLFCVTGFLGLPLLWMNPNFTRLQRWLWAIVVTIYTFALIGVVCWVVVWSWNSISESL